MLRIAAMPSRGLRGAGVPSLVLVRTQSHLLHRSGFCSGASQSGQRPSGVVVETFTSVTGIINLLSEKLILNTISINKTDGLAATNYRSPRRVSRHQKRARLAERAQRTAA